MPKMFPPGAARPDLLLACWPAWLLAVCGLQPLHAEPAPSGIAIELAVDATDLAHRVLQVRETLQLPAGPSRRLALYYPRFLPGTHGPYGNVAQLAGLQVSLDGMRLPWRRSALDTHAFEIDWPGGSGALKLDFQYLAPVRPGGDRISITRQILGLEWETVLLYPAGAAVSEIGVQPRLRLPPGWQAASALRAPAGEPAPADGEGWIAYGPVSLETLVDSPVFAGLHSLRIALDGPGPTPAAPVALTLFADEAAQLEASPVQIEAHRRLLQQATILFGSRPWRHYDFLLALSDEFGGIGLEHQESSENGLRPDYFKDWELAIRGRELLPHEFVHAWNGKYRRPVDLWTPDYQQTMGNSLLWVYEGLTQYWGHLLAARSGLATVEQARDRLAGIAAEAQARSGRAWRSLQDTTNEPSLGPGHSAEWEDWQRGGDYYDEGLLIWLAADALIREQSGGRRSLDDLAQRFFGLPASQHLDGSLQTRTYDLAELLAALNAVQPWDWAGWLGERLARTGGAAPLDGLAGAGWQLVWQAEESRYAANERGWSGPAGNERPQDLAYSLGLRITADGKLDQVYWDSPAYRAGLAPGMTLLAVNGRGYKPERLARAVAANRDGSAPIALLYRDGEHYASTVIDWRGGLRYPALAALPGRPDRLAAIYAAR